MKFNSSKLIIFEYMSPYLFFQTILEFFLARLPMLPFGLIQYYQITCQPVNQATCIFIIRPIVFGNLISIKILIIYYYFYFHY